MGDMVPRERDLLAVDLESGGTTSEEEGNVESVITGARQKKKYLGRVWSGVINVDGLIKDEYGVRASNSVLNFSEKSSGSEENVGLMGKKSVKEKRKKTGSKKPPKPPRPPGGPSLDAADQKLVREISELAMLKRARVERMKAQKKMKAAKALSSSSSSSSSSLCALVVTVLFCLVILFQGNIAAPLFCRRVRIALRKSLYSDFCRRFVAIGLFSRSNSHASFEGSPESARATRGPLISVQYYKNPAAGNINPSSESPNLAEQISRSDPQEENSRVAG
ncbi:hypothetical protein IFM89_015343 [Coptis chinensis]|uniref:Transmembrane protein n=1 Tax=Coptis chinensis TaxID=261450 RepID=A0A835INI0_9MAGN|nr:hypothetical protein IFM89_015343 [Coptis chinensis]